MKMLTILLQASSAPASGSAAPGAAGTSSMMFWIMIIAMFVILWLFMIRPQRKQQKELENFRKSLKKGDKVVTVGGIYGVIDEINEKSALIKVDGDVKLRVDKNSLVKDYSDAKPK